MGLSQHLKDQDEEAQRKAAAAAPAAERAAHIRTVVAAAYDAATAGMQGLTLPSLLVHSLYGKEALLMFRPERYRGPGMPAAQIVELLDRMPPVLAGMARGTFFSFMPKSYADTAKKKGSDELEWPKFTPSPLIFQIDHLMEYGSKVELRWVTNLGGYLVEIQIELARGLGMPGLKIQTQQYQGRLIRIVNVSPCLTGDLRNEPMPQVARYASGDSLSVGTHIFYGEGLVEPLIHKMAELDKAAAGA